MARATTPATTLQESVDLLEQDVNDFHNILNGDVNTTVTLDSGSVSSVKKALAEMAAYKTPIAWVQGNTATDILQPRTYSGNAYVPTTVPVVMGTAPDSTWKVYSYTVTDVDEVTVSQTTGDNEAVTLRHTDVAHGMTDLVSDGDDSVYGYMESSSAFGGLEVVGISESTAGVDINGVGTTPQTGDTAGGPIILTSSKKSGTGQTSLANDENIAAFRNFGVIKVVVKGNGDIKTQGGVYAVGDIQGLSSDERLKENIQPITNAVDKVKELNGVTFNFNDKAKEFGLPEEGQVGLIAQDVEKVIPEAVMPFAFDPEYKNVKYDKLVALLVESVKELTARVEELENGSTK